MKFANILMSVLAALAVLVVVCFNSIAYADDGYDLWLKFDKIEDAALLKEYGRAVANIVVQGKSETVRIVRDELENNLSRLMGGKIPLKSAVSANGSIIAGTPQNSSIVKDMGLSGELQSLGEEGYLIKSVRYNGFDAIVIAANTDIALLYGAFDFLRLMQTRKSLENLSLSSNPKIQLRLLNHWDNLDGSVERGYAGKSLWKWDELPDVTLPRYKDYARANASLGINGTVVNNVNANPQILKPEYIQKMTKLADIFRPYGITLYLSINFSSPLQPASGSNRRRGGIGNLESADPAKNDVKEWWKAKAAELYKSIPDFGGFLVKANSEGMPGPQDYGRTQAEGANMLAEALEPYGGIVIWRSFVYDPNVDSDRVKRAYLEFTPLDGKFHKNVFVQPKNGPLDFQPREPVHQLFGAMPQTPLMLELQITQEYLGHSTHLVYLAPMWKEALDFDTYAMGKGSKVSGVVDGSVHNSTMTGIAGVTNIGDDRNWCGHIFAQSNWYAYGRLAWDHSLSSEHIADEWIRMTLSDDDATVNSIKTMMLGSWEACINYMTPLGLHHIMQEGFHYGPEPSLAKKTLRIDWTSAYYHRADNRGLGYNRSSSGSGATGQYFSPVAEKFDSIETCPEKYLLWFHHVDWDHKMMSGRTMWDELCYKYSLGVKYVENMRVEWDTLEKSIDPEIFQHVRDKLKTHVQDAAVWKETCVKYFQTFSRKPVPEF
ncbi:alpha-glucuronidase family glycosyl hydrolase [Candidatus Latescibacterota bacterium]